MNLTLNFGNSPNCGCGGPSAGGMGGAFPQARAMMQMMMQMMQMMQMMMGNSGGHVPFGGNFGNGGFGGGAPMGGHGLGNFLGGGAPFGGGGSPFGGGGSPSLGGGSPNMGGAHNSAPVNPGTPGANGTGQAAVDLARKYLGRDSIGLKGDMPHFTAAGGVTNNCVDFVSSALESQGLVKGHHINVKAFEKELQKQGYRQIPAAQAQPGDVWINHSRGHTELVATAGAKTLIGSNGSARQKVTEHANNPSSGIIYSRR